MTTAPPRPVPDRRATATFWVAMAAGGAVVAYGTVNLIQEQRDGLRSIATWFVGGALAIDLVIVPVAAVTGWLLVRALPRPAWPPVRAALLTSAVLVAFALPLVTHQGGRPDNPSLRPRHYGTGLAWTLAAVWLVAALVAAVRCHRSRRSSR